MSRVLDRLRPARLPRIIDLREDRRNRQPCRLDGA
jgi:hypothetical protein